MINIPNLNLSKNKVFLSILLVLLFSATFLNSAYSVPGEPPPPPPASYCGDGNCDPDEDCSLCDIDCGPCAPMCGDWNCDPGEDCVSCESDCGPCPAECGNGILEEVEECDPPNGTDCNGNCEFIECGDGMMEGSEECDPPDGASCNYSCEFIECGDGMMEGSEECDPPDGTSCNDACEFIECGDGMMEGSEECDPPNGTDCNGNCEFIECGDGMMEGSEECDPPNGTSCNDACEFIECGDGIMEGSEECDPPDGTSCNDACELIECGDGMMEGSEECDPPDGTSCNDACELIECGDGMMEGSEECDPPDGTSCDNDCKTIVATCGDGNCDPDEDCSSCDVDCGTCPATCGDGNCDPDEDCSSCDVDCGTCPASCGDGNCDPGEDCSSCDVDCGTCPATCGDGNCDPDEDCTSCDVDCGICPASCGDGVMEGSEECDPPNGTDCDNDCRVIVSTCGNTVCDSDEDCATCESDCGQCTGECGDSPLQGVLCHQPPDNSCSLPADITVKLEDGPEESIFDRGAIIEELSPTSCLYLEPLPPIPPNLFRRVDVFDLSENCAPCSSSVKDLIYAYYDGDPSAGSSLCALPPDELNNCVVFESNEQLIHYDDPPDPWEEIITDLLSPITDANNRDIYNMQGRIDLTLAEEDRLLKRWPSDHTRYYAATRQHWFAYAGLFPQDIVITFPPAPPQIGGNGQPVRVHYENRTDLLAAMISPTQALMDFQDAIAMGTNFWPDIRGADGLVDPVNGVFGRRNAGSLDYEFMVAYVQNGPPSNRTYRPYYHANFIDPFPLFLFARLIDATGNLSNAFRDTWINWNVDRSRAQAIPLPVPPPPGAGIYPPYQIPERPWWAANAPPPGVQRFAVIINGAVQGGSELELFSFITDIADIFGFTLGPDSEGESFIKANTIDYINNILRNELNYPANNIAVYDVSGDSLPNVMAFQTKINTIINRARTIRTNNPNANIELVFYFHGHGKSVKPEDIRPGQPPIDMAWFKEGGLEHEFWLGGQNSLMESTLKDFANGFVNSNNNPNANDRIFDRIDFIDGSCESGAGIY